MRLVGLGTPVRGVEAGGVVSWQGSVKDKDLTAPPGSPSTGDRYIVASVATGAWTGQEDDIAEWTGSAWSFDTPLGGWAVWVDDENEMYVFDGSSWNQESLGVHDIVGALHTASGLTIGHVLTALSATTFGFQAAGGGGAGQLFTMPFTFLNNGAVLNTGVQEAAYLQVPCACEIKNVRMYGSPSGSIVVDLWKDTYANYPPAVGDSIVASAPPTISSGVKSEDTTLSGWSKTLAEGDGILPDIVSVTNMTWVKVVLLAERL